MVSGEDYITRAFMICSYSPSDISWLFKSRRMRWGWEVAHMGGEQKCIQGYGGKT